MSLIDNVCNDPIFRDRVGDAVANKVKRSTDGEEISTVDGSYNIQVSDVSIAVDDADFTPIDDSADGLEVDVAVKGASTAKGTYTDSENEEHGAEQNGTFEGIIRVRFPSDTLSADIDSIVEGIEIDEDDISISIENDRDQ